MMFDRSRVGYAKEIGLAQPVAVKTVRGRQVDIHRQPVDKQDSEDPQQHPVGAAVPDARRDTALKQPAEAFAPIFGAASDLQPSFRSC